jgi:hypothetical protein
MYNTTCTLVHNLAYLYYNKKICSGTFLFGTGSRIPGNLLCCIYDLILISLMKCEIQIHMKSNVWEVIFLHLKRTVTICC